MIENLKMKLEEINKKKKLILNQSNSYYFDSVVTEIENSRWFKQIDTPIVFDKEQQIFQSKLPKDKHAYISYIEKNTNFSIAPKQSLSPLLAEDSCAFEMKGKTDESVHVSLVVIFYSNNKKLYSISLEMNEQKRIKINDEVNGFRVSIRVKGNGTFTIDSITANNKILWQVQNVSTPFHMINGTDWYLPNKKGVSYDSELNTFEFNLVEQTHVYIPYNETNDNFNHSDNLLKITRNKLSVWFAGKKSSSLDVKLFIIFYNSKKEKQQNEQIELNSKALIHVPEDTSGFRLAIRVSGKGSLQLSTIAISGEGFWFNKPIETFIRKIPKSDFSYDLDYTSLFGFDDKKNRLLFYRNEEVIESHLVGNQYLYLSCFEDTDIEIAPEKPILKPKENHYYEFFPRAIISGETNLMLTILEYRYDKKVGVQQVPFNQWTTVKFEEYVTDIKCLVRVNGKGSFKKAKLLINEKEVKILNRLNVDLDNNLWFQSGQRLKLENIDGSLHVSSEIKDDRKMYISYKEQNNAFRIPPTTHLISINYESVYEFDIRAKVEGIEFIPMLVQYSGEEKIQINQLKVNSKTLVQMNPKTTGVRISFRFTGQGECIVERFSILEKEAIQTKQTFNWIDERELIKLGLVKPKEQKELKMAVIFDEFTMAAYQEECNLITFTPDNWLEVLTVNHPDLLMVESAWQGNNGTWNKRVGYYGEENMKPLFSLLKWCNENNIPTVFWNKEDPVHFDRFIETAIKFDYIFTTDENMVDEYKKRAGHEDVYALPFAAQPVINNPIKIVDRRENKACFAGSYYRHHEERAKDMDRVLDGAVKYGIDIYDRNYEKNLKGLMPNHRFPERFEPYIKGSLKYYEIDKAYKGYKVMINVNTVKHSPTMFSRRVFEGLACGTPIVSTYAEGIENFFGDLVYVSEEKEEIDNAFRILLNDEIAYRKKAILGIREVLSKHTYARRLNFVANIVGLKVRYELPKVKVIAFASSKEEFDLVLKQFERQVYKNKELYVVIDLFDGYLDYYQTYNNHQVKTFIGSYMKKYKNIKEWIDTPYVAYFSKYDYYGENYLLDLMLCTTFTDSDFIGKNSFYEVANNDYGLVCHNEDSEYEFVSSLNPNRSVIKTDTFSKESLMSVFDHFKSNNDMSDYLKFGKSFYSNDKFNYLSNAYKDGNQEIKNEVLNQIEI